MPPTCGPRARNRALPKRAKSTPAKQRIVILRLRPELLETWRPQPSEKLYRPDPAAGDKWKLITLYLTPSKLAEEETRLAQQKPSELLLALPFNTCEDSIRELREKEYWENTGRVLGVEVAIA